ncbi:MAG: TetR/AcrR family transcriptional regulator [Microbacterium sp.]|uniref:TetR/AcrR family transcriptional regulator n=1 Tax=Microbacterium sp. TaxID=51671 RepID=UPI0039E33418
MAAGGGSTLRQRQHERTRGDVVRAALRLIAANGTRGMTIDGIVSEAGISRGTLYAHFPDGQGDVVRAAYDQLGEEVLASGAARAALHDDWIGRLTAHAEAMVDLAEEPELGFFYNISGPGRLGLDHQSGVGSRGHRAVFHDELAAAQRDGRIPADIDVAATALLMVGMMRQTGIDVARDSSLGPRCLGAFRAILAALARR